MTSRLRSVLGWGALAAVAATLTAAFVLSATRAGLRDEIFARLRDYEAQGVPLSREALAEAPPATTDTAERMFADFLQRKPFRPSAWEPPAGTQVDSLAFDELAEERVFAADLTEAERKLLYLWLASLKADLASFRSLVGQPLHPVEDDDLTTLISEMIGVTRAFSTRAILAAYEQDVNGALDDLSNALEVTTLLDHQPLALFFLAWVYCDGLTLDTIERVLEILPAGSDLSVLAKRLADRSVEERLRRAFEGERVYYLENLGLVRDGEILPEEGVAFFARSPWRPWTWTPAAERRVLADLRVFELMLAGGSRTTDPPPYEAASSNVQTLVDLDVAQTARAHVAAVERLRARLVAGR